MRIYSQMSIIRSAEHTFAHTDKETAGQDLTTRAATGSALPPTVSPMGVGTSLAVRRAALGAPRAQMTTTLVATVP